MNPPSRPSLPLDLNTSFAVVIYSALLRRLTDHCENYDDVILAPSHSVQGRRASFASARKSIAINVDKGISI